MTQLFQYKPLKNIDLKEPFFDSLRLDYAGFDAWYKRKADGGRKAFVLYGQQGLLAFVFLKSEIDECIEDVEPPLEPCRRLKVGTLKIEAHQTNLGERALKIIFDEAILYRFEEIYLTSFPKHTSLIKLLETYGFKQIGRKGGELVLAKSMASSSGDIQCDYPRFSLDRRVFLLAVKPEYHTELFPDSILNNEQAQSKGLIQDCSHTNSIRKVYISRNREVTTLREGDLLAIYRTSDEQAPAHYRSVVTSICTVREVKAKECWKNYEEFLKDVLPYSVFSREELTNFYHQKEDFYVIYMLYNCALPKRVTRKSLIEEARMDGKLRWGFLPLTNEQFKYILDKGDVSKGLIID